MLDRYKLLLLFNLRIPKGSSLGSMSRKMKRLTVAKPMQMDTQKGLVAVILGVIVMPRCLQAEL